MSAQSSPFTPGPSDHGGKCLEIIISVPKKETKTRGGWEQPRSPRARIQAQVGLTSKLLRPQAGRETEASKKQTFSSREEDHSGPDTKGRRPGGPRPPTLPQQSLHQPPRTHAHTHSCFEFLVHHRRSQRTSQFIQLPSLDSPTSSEDANPSWQPWPVPDDVK